MGGWLIYKVVGEGIGGGYYLVDSAFVFFYLCFAPFFHVLCPFFFSDWSMVAVVSVFFSFISFLLSLVPLIGSYLCIKIVVYLIKSYLKSQYLIINLWISLEKGDCLN